MGQALAGFTKLSRGYEPVSTRTLGDVNLNPSRVGTSSTLAAEGGAFDAAADTRGLANGFSSSGASFEGATASQVQINRAAGHAWENELIQSVLPRTQTSIQPQITIKSSGPSGLRVRMDAVGTDIQSGLFGLTDGKASMTAPLTPNQFIVYPELNVFGGTVVGKGKSPYVGGTVIPPTQVDIIRKP